MISASIFLFFWLLGGCLQEIRVCQAGHAQNSNGYGDEGERSKHKTGFKIPSGSPAAKPFIVKFSRGFACLFFDCANRKAPIPRSPRPLTRRQAKQSTSLETLSLFQKESLPIIFKIISIITIWEWIWKIRRQLSIYQVCRRAANLIVLTKLGFLLIRSTNALLTLFSNRTRFLLILYMLTTL